MLEFAEIEERVETVQSAEAGAPVSAGLGLCKELVVIVDPDGAVAERPRDPPGGVAAIGPDRSRQSVDRVIGLGDRLGLVGEGLDHQQRPEDLFLAEVGLRIAMGNERRRQERRTVGSRFRNLVAKNDLVGRVECRVDALLDAVARASADQRAHLGARAEAVADLDGLQGGGQGGLSLLEAAFVDEYAPRGSALLARYDRRSRGQARGDRRDVGVFEDEAAVLSAEFEESFFIVGAAAAMMAWPTSFDPVKEMTSTSGLSTSA